MDILVLLAGGALGYAAKWLNTEYQVRYSELYKHRVEAIEGLHARAANAARLLPIWIDFEDREEANRKGYEWIEAMGELSDYYDEHSLWLEQHTGKHVEAFLKECQDLVAKAVELSRSEDMSDFRDPENLKEKLRQDHALRERFLSAMREATENRKRIREELSKIKGELSEELRETLWGSDLRRLVGSLLGMLAGAQKGSKSAQTSP